MPKVAARSYLEPPVKRRKAEARISDRWIHSIRYVVWLVACPYFILFLKLALTNLYNKVNVHSIGAPPQLKEDIHYFPPGSDSALS